MRYVYATIGLVVAAYPLLFSCLKQVIHFNDSCRSLEKIYQEEHFRANVLNLFFCRTAFELKEDDVAKLPSRSLSPIKQQPSTSTAPERTTSTPSSKKTVTTIKPKPKNEKRTPFLTRAFFNTVAPGLASFAETPKSEFDIVVEDEEDVEQDPDVVAMMADF